MMHLAHEGEKICIASLEMKPKKTLRRIVHQLSNSKHPDNGKTDICFDWFDDKFWIFDVVGEIQPKMLLETFLYAYQRYGVTQFVIDSFMRCGVDEDDLNGQKKFMNMIVAFVNQYDVHIHLVAHPRKGLNEEHYIGKMDVKGSGCITDLVWNFFAIWRNKAKEAIKRGEPAGEIKKGRMPLEEPDALFICEKQRDGEWEGKMGLYFCHDSQRFYDDENYRAPNYLGGTPEEPCQSTMAFSAPQDHDDESLDEWGEE
jgi:twinkle protein